MGHLYAQNKFCLIKTCDLISKSLFYSDELVAFSPVTNAQCQSNMRSMRKILPSCPWKNLIYFNWNGLFTCPKIYFVWLKLALSSRKSPNTSLNFDLFANSQHSMLVKHDFNETIITLISRNTMRRSQWNHKFQLSIQSAGIARHEY